MPVIDETLKPYQGPPPTPENFGQAFPQYEQALKKGVNNLDQDSQTNLNELRRQMRSSPPKPATVINLHPWPLTFGATNRFLRGITIPACEPGMPYAYHHIRGYRTDWEYNENGTLKFKAILPIELAGQFVREFSNKDSYGGGVIIYEGEGNPEKVDLVESYDPIGRVQTIQKSVIVYDEENRPIQEMGEIPIRKKLNDLLVEARSQRNAAYLLRVRKADHDYNLPDGRGKWLINDTHPLMAEILFAEGVISEVPKWNLASRFEQGLSENNCKSCGSPTKTDSYKCACGNILDPLAAYMDFAIEYGHAKMEMLASDEWEQVEEEKLRRQSAKSQKSKAGNKAKED
jgi:hypothetical protein